MQSRIIAIRTGVHTYLGFPDGAVVKNLPEKQEPQETWVWSLGGEHPLEEGMATHSNVLVWRISWPEEPGRLQSMTSQRVRHNWSDLTHTHVYLPTRHAGVTKKGQLNRLAGYNPHMRTLVECFQMGFLSTQWAAFYNLFLMKIMLTPKTLSPVGH